MIDRGVPVAFESLTVDATSGGVKCTELTIQNSGNQVQKAFMTLESYQIRFTIDGTAPTAAVGHLLEVGQTLTLSNYDQIRKFRAFRTVEANSGILKITYYTDEKYEG